MEIVKLPIERREKLGSAESRRVRRTGRLPAVLYGLDRPPVPLTVETHTFEKEFHHGHRMFTLTLEDKTQLCLLKDIQFDALGDRMVHLDFIRVDENKPVTVRVALEFVGSPPPVSGAVIDTVTPDINVTCLPRDIPEKIEVHIGDLAAGEHIEARSLDLPEGVALAMDEHTTIVTYHYKHAGLVTTEAEPAEEEASAEPEVLTGRKPAEDES